MERGCVGCDNVRVGSDRLTICVKKGIITAEQYKEIVGENYSQ